MTVDHYAGAGRGWAQGASRVYQPIASQLVDMSPHPLSGRTVLDAGAGTGVASTALAVRGAHPIATDLSLDMLAWNAALRPPCVAADLRALPLAGDSVDDSVAAFVLNHLTDPGAGLAELIRVTRAGGAVLATVYSNASRSGVRDLVDEVAKGAGWQIPDWYLETKANVVPLLGSAGAMAAAAHTSGQVDVVVEERPRRRRRHRARAARRLPLRPGPLCGLARQHRSPAWRGDPAAGRRGDTPGDGTLRSDRRVPLSSGGVRTGLFGRSAQRRLTNRGLTDGGLGRWSARCRPVWPLVRSCHVR